MRFHLRVVASRSSDAEPRPVKVFGYLDFWRKTCSVQSLHVPHGGLVDKERTIFIVDDDQGLQDFVFTFLSARGYQVECFGSGKALLSRLRGGSCSGLILLDVVMPGCDGVEVIRRIRGIGSNIPVIML